MTAPGHEDGSPVGPWQATETGAERRLDSEGRTCAIIFPPGGADEGRWGWWGHNGRESQGGKAQSKEKARRLANRAAGLPEPLFFDRRRLPPPHPALVVVSPRARRRNARFLANPGRRRAGAVPVGYDYRGTPHESAFLERLADASAGGALTTAADMFRRAVAESPTHGAEEPEGPCRPRRPDYDEWVVG